MNDSLDRDPVVLLNDVARIMRTRFDQRARARGMTRAQWHILARVDRQPGLSQRELAAICEVEPITVARLVDRLEQHGLLERRPDPADRRIRRLHNLPGAREVLDEINAYREEFVRDIDDQIGRDAREAMVDSLLVVRAHLSSADEMPAAAADVRASRS
ncbi:MAG: MarR family transcriptional regulator [Pseudomonadales bacterium]